MKPDGTLHEPLCNDADASGEVGQAVRQRVGDITLGAKDSPHLLALEAPINVEQVERFAKVVSRIFDYISGINTIGNQPFPELTKTNGRGGMSGPVVAEVAKAHLRICRSVAPELAYLSCGGVDSSNANTEVVERLELGALLVGGAQEFYRVGQPHKLVADWAIATI